jgi:hypothetical protein
LGLLITGRPLCIWFELSSPVRKEALGGSNCGGSFHLNDFGPQRTPKDGRASLKAARNPPRTFTDALRAQGAAEELVELAGKAERKG